MTAAQDIRRIADAIERIASALTPPQGPVVPPPLPQASSDPSSPAPAEPALVELDRIEAQRDVISAAIALRAGFVENPMEHGRITQTPQWWTQLHQFMRAVDELVRLDTIKGGAA